MADAAIHQADTRPGLGSSRVRVPLLSELLGQVAVENRGVWVDLGRAQFGLIARLARARSRLIVADLPSARTEAQPDWYLPDAILDAPFWVEAVDHFLCWDLLNYMQKSELFEFSRCVARRSVKNCTIHALIQYSSTTMPETPARFDLESSLELSMHEAGTAAIPTPRYSPKALEKSMPELRVERTMLLNNGMQEFLFGLR